MTALRKTLFIIISALVLLSCASEEHELQIIHSIQNDPESYFYTDLDLYKKTDEKLPIGIFDSGTGGLTVLDAIVNFDKFNNDDHSPAELGDSVRDFNKECFIYLADQANMPYGNYEAHNQELLLREHILKDMQFLLSDKYYSNPEDAVYSTGKSPIKAMVIACNTATAFGINDIRNFVRSSGINLKVIGVIGAGVRASLENFDEMNNSAIAVFATAGTVASGGYVEELSNQLAEKKARLNIAVYQQAGVGLAGAIDGVSEFIDRSAAEPRTNYKGPSDQNNELFIDKTILNRYNFDWSSNNMLYSGDINDPHNIQVNSIDNYISYHITSLLEKMRLRGDTLKLKRIILGCTHYPYYTELFREKFLEMRSYMEEEKFIYDKIIGEEIIFIDPAVNTAKELYTFLNNEDLFNKGDIFDSEFYISVPNPNNPSIMTDESGKFSYEYKYGRDVNKIQEYVKRIPFSKNNIALPVIERLREKVPFTFDLIKSFNLNNEKTKYLPDDAKIK